VTVPDLSASPNALAKPLKVQVQVKGYQCFEMGPDGIFTGQDRLFGRLRLLGDHFRPKMLAGRTFLDLGANAGYWSFLAQKHGASRILAVEMDPDYRRVIRGISDLYDLGITVTKRVQDVRSRFDVVNALALVHWLYCCTADFGSLEAVVDFLAARTKERLHVEWVAPEDPNVEQFGHTRWRPEIVTGPYTEEAFLYAMRSNFREVVHCGDLTPTRKIYVGLK